MKKIDYELLSDTQIDRIIQEERNYRLAHGGTIGPEENVCRNCRNIDVQNHFCWDCAFGSLYVPMTRPLYNIALMLFAVNSALQGAENDENADQNMRLRQTGMLTALQFVLHPFGIENVAKKFLDDATASGIDFSNQQEIENAEAVYTFEQGEETEEEKHYRAKVGTARAHEKVCIHCKYNDRFGTQFCWDCDRGTNFRSGIRSINTIGKMFACLNTVAGEDIVNQAHDTEKTILRISVIEGLKWIIAPYTTEEELLEKQDEYGECVSKRDMDFIIKTEDEEYEELDNYEDS
ncbi:MAG: hypothetical protein LBR23_06930 [Spirochaetaceae bacterium]|jgi:hypothetical protein|nr:hypothetical protein [Spirochaetaceae bacterium]